MEDPIGCVRGVSGSSIPSRPVSGCGDISGELLVTAAVKKGRRRRAREGMIKRGERREGGGKGREGGGGKVDGEIVGGRKRREGEREAEGRRNGRGRG